MYLKTTFSILCLLAISSISMGQYFVDTPHGRVNGMVHFTVDANRYIAFAGIPYAHDTSGPMRFKPSTLYPLEELLEVNGGEYNATRGAVICPQDALFDPIALPREDDEIFQKEGKVEDPAEAAEIYETLTQQMKEKRRASIKAEGVMGAEDCLILNINTPNLPDEGGNYDQLYPVIVFIHGGGSNRIWSSLWNGLRFMNHPVVLVSINYRLGILGGMNLGIDGAPGNAALYDALNSLKWIKEYIAHFGGDPNRVTITGQSAGAMMVSQLMASRMADGYYHGVIGSSGSATAVWGTARRPSLPFYLDVAFFAGCYNKDLDPEDDLVIAGVLECMESVDYKDLVWATNNHTTHQENNGLGLGFDAKVASVQDSPKLVNTQKIVPEAPLGVFERGEQYNVPLMMGSTRHDGTYFLDKLYEDYIKHNGLEKNETYLKNDLLPNLMNFIGLEDIDDRSSGNMLYSLGKTFMKEAYRSPGLPEKFPGLIDLTSVFGMKSASLQLLELHEKIQRDVYYYDFDYRGMWTLYYIVLVSPDSIIPGGVAHTDDMLYLFQFLPLIWNNDLYVAKRFTQYWVNFAYYGNPNGPDGEAWPAYTKEGQEIIVIKKDDYVYNGNTRDRWVGVAHELYPNGVPPLP